MDIFNFTKFFIFMIDNIDWSIYIQIIERRKCHEIGHQD